MSRWRSYWQADFDRIREEVGETPARLVDIEPGVYNPIWKKRTNLKSSYSVTVAPDRAAPPRERNLVLCIDGTWNRPQSRTNVYLLSQALTRAPSVQKVLYYDGVGVRMDQGAALDVQRAKQRLRKALGHDSPGLERRTLKALGGAAGRGAASLRRRVFFDLICNHQPGDRIFIFGFSRGAAIARILANTIEDHGLPERLTAVFSKNPNGPDEVMDIGEPNRESPKLEVSFFGVWDTVPSFGLTRRNLFKDLSMPGNLLAACHLLAIDERRNAFTPRLLDPAPHVEEVWFPGVHTSVGGGYRRPDGAQDFGVSDMSLRHMMRRAQEHGALFENGAFAGLEDDPLGPIAAKNPFFYREGDRTIRVGDGGSTSRRVPKVHWSVEARRRAGLDPPYDPAPLRALGTDGYELISQYRNESEAVRDGATGS